MKKNIILLILCLPFLTAIDACTHKEPVNTKKNTQARKAENAANSLSFGENAEIDNIKKRLELTSSPGLLGYVLLLNEAGQPIYYTSIKGKITSGGKRLTKPWTTKYMDCGQSGCDRVVQAPSDEGTHGKSSPYVFFWTANGQYFQWNGKYLYSDKPFRLTVKPLVIDIKNKTLEKAK